VSEKRQLVKYFEFGVLILGFFIIAEGFRDFLPTWNPIRAGYLGLLGIVILLNIETVLKVVIRSPHILILIIFAVLSAIWSESRSATISRAVALFITSGFAAYLASKYTLREQVRVIGVVMVMYVVTSLLVIAAVPSIAMAGSAFEGIFTQKNVFGRVMTIGLIVSLVYPAETPRENKLKIIGAVLCSFLIVMSISMTSMITAVAVVILFFAYRVLRLGALLFIIMVLAFAVPFGIAAYAAANIDTDAVLISLGRDPTLTGRTELWENVRFAIEQRPLLGYGYGAFWNMSGGMYGTLWNERSNWQPGSAHNSYLDVTVNLGYVGLGLFLFGFAITLIQALRRVRTSDTPEGLWPALYMGFLLVFSFSEDFILINHIFWTLYVTIAFTLNKPISIEEPEKYQPRRYITGLSTPATVQQQQLPTGG
jgi:exopolysaccharide production protein ExoQ